jgi:hypothetical protein
MQDIARSTMRTNMQCMQRYVTAQQWLVDAHVRNMMPWEMPKPTPLICARFSDDLVGGPSSLVYSCEMLSSIWNADTWQGAE